MKPFFQSLFFAFILIFVAPTFSIAQKFSGSFFGGLSSSQVAGDRLSGFNKAGVIAGASVFLPVKSSLGVEMEIQFIQKGSKKPVDAESEDLEYYRMHLNYVEVPFLFHYSYSKRFQFNAGFSVGQLLSSKEEDAGGEIPESQTLPFEKTEFAVCGGMYYGFNEKFFLDLRLSNSILPIRKIGESNIQNIKSGQYNTVLSFTLKYRMGFKQP
ncbi:MAG: PorT family protein [Bacteroidetes bacterium]|nr:PorT family protein [Bacteroidota bacterium]